MRRQFGRLEQAFRIVVTPVRIDPRDPRVAALLLHRMQSSTDPPDQWIPPVQHGHDEFEDADPMVAAAQMGQLMSQHHRRLALVQRTQQAQGKDDRRSPPKAPDERRHGAVDHANVGRSPEPHPVRKFVRDGLKSLRSGQRAGQHSMKSGNPEPREKCNQPGAADPDPHHHGTNRAPGRRNRDAELSMKSRPWVVRPRQSSDYRLPPG